MDDVKEVYHIFQELIKTIRRRRKLSNNDRLRFVIQNEATKRNVNEIQQGARFQTGDLEQVIKILEYRDIPLENSKIVIQSVKIPASKVKEGCTLQKIPFQERIA